MTNEIELVDQHTSIKIHWEDTLDNYSMLREKEIEKYFKNKYKTEKVRVIFKALLNKQSDLTVEGSVDASEMVLDENYQQKLIDKYLTDNKISVDPAFLNKLDGTVNTYLEDYKDTTSRYKKYKIKEIYFSNFLSYGPKNKLSITDQPGITSIVSDPANYGGKTTATIDVLLFLFFGDTTKTEKNADVFNRFTSEDNVKVGGVIEIEGEIYILERTLTRTMQKSGEYKVTSTLDFQKKLPRGGYKNLKGDERKITEELINTYVGNKQDFLITIVSTGDNLDDLIKTKPTERGRILTRFIGLEYFREKEKIGKNLYDEWQVTSKIHKYSLEDINKDLVQYNTQIEEIQFMMNAEQSTVDNLKQEIDTTTKKREALINQRIPVDIELYKVNEEEIKTAISGLEIKIKERTTAYEAAKADMVKPTIEYDVDKLAVLERELMENRTAKIQHEATISTLEHTNKMLKESEVCFSCKRPLEGVDYSSQVAENGLKINDLVTKISNLNELITISLRLIDEIKETKQAWDEFSKKELITNKIKFELEQYEASLNRGKTKLNDYLSNKVNVETNRRIDTEIQVIKSQLENLEEQKDTHYLKFMGYDRDIQIAKAKIEEYNILIKEIKKEEIIDKIYRTYLNIYGKNGISKMVLSTMIPLINMHLKTFLSETSEFILEMKMNDKNEIDFWMVDEKSDVRKPLAAGSGYEKTVSSLALRCVLAKVCSLPKPNIIMFDEVFGKVSHENLDKIGLFFDKVKEHFEHIWLISHNPLITEWADHTIKVRKTNNISELITE